MKPRVFHALFVLTLALWPGMRPALAQDDSASMLARSRFRSGAETLAAFAPISAVVTNSIVEVNVDGDAVALGTVVDAAGLVLTKASEIKPGKLTCWLATGREVPAVRLAVDEDQDMALLRVRAEGLKPVRWAEGKSVIGAWAVTPALAETPQAVGIISAQPRQIKPERAYIGISWFPELSVPKVKGVLPGLGAEEAGIKPGDVITAVNNELVTTRERIMEITRGLREGQSVHLKLERDGQPFEVTIKLRVLKREEYIASRNSLMTGETSRRADGFDQVIEHDTVIPPWLCGGPVMNLEGEAIGINIARANRAATYALPAELVQQIFATLKPAATNQ
jgi:serine protease Do